MNVRSYLAFAAVVALTAAWTAPAPAQSIEPPPTVTLQLTDAPLHQALTLLFKDSGRQFQLERGATGSVNAVLNDVPWEVALRMVLEAQGLSYRIQDNVYIVGPKPATPVDAPPREPPAYERESGVEGKPRVSVPGSEAKKVEVIKIQHNDPAMLAAIFGGESVGFLYGGAGLGTYGIGGYGYGAGYGGYGQGYGGYGGYGQQRYGGYGGYGGYGQGYGGYGTGYGGYGGFGGGGGYGGYGGYGGLPMGYLGIPGYGGGYSGAVPNYGRGSQVAGWISPGVR